MPKFAANLSLTFGELDFLDRPAAAAEQGFDAVEFMFPYDWDARELQERIDAAGLPVALFNAPPGDTRGMAALPGLEAEFRESVELALSYAAVLGAPKLHIMAGVAADTPENRATYTANIRWAAQQAQAQAQSQGEPVLIVLEPINAHSIPGYFLHSLDQATELIAEINEPNVKILFDVFHVQQIHGDLSRRLRALTDSGLLGHIQTAAVPERHEPGTGEVDDDRIFRLIDTLGYPGYIGGEYNPAGATVAGLGWLRLGGER